MVSHNRFNSYLQFIRPDEPKKPQLQINTDPLGISYHSRSPSLDRGYREDQYYSDIFRQLHFPHDKPRRPSLSPSPSPSSSSVSPLNSPVHSQAIPLGHHHRQRVPRRKCSIRRGQSLTSPPPSAGVTAASWGHIQSPAAMFLASFASPVSQTPIDEQDGDEIDDYVLENKIGYGGFSVVRRGYCISDGHTVAVKVIKKTMMSELDMIRLERELAIWESLDHPHLVGVEKVLETDHAMYIVCTHCSKGSLLALVQQQPVSESRARELFGELCAAVRYLHQQARVCHKDLKLDNILLDDQGRVKVCDFGLAMYQSPPSETEVAGGSLAYAAPEQIRSSYALPCPKTDMWSLGVVLFALIAGQLPFRDDYDLRLQQKILEGQIEWPTNMFSPELEDLLRNLLHPDPFCRYTIDQAIQSRWLQQV